MILIMTHKLLLCCVVFALCEGYYWKDWNGSIPIDAFKAGRDSRGDAYIAQAYVPHTGIYVGQLSSHQKDLFVSTVVFGNKPVNKTDYDVKILCTDNHDLNWMVSNMNKTRDVLSNSGIHLVKGGVTSANNIIYIGKQIDNDYVYIGSVHGDWHSEYWFYYSNAVPVSGFNTYYEILITD